MHFAVRLCTTKLAQTNSQYYCVLQCLHTVFPSTTVYYKACTQYFPVLLCTTKLAHSISQYYFVLRSLRKVRPSTTLWFKVGTKKAFTQQFLSQRSFYTQQPFYTEKLLHTEAFIHNKLLHREVFTHRKLLHGEAFTQSKLSRTASVYTEHLHTVVLHMASVYTQKLLHRDAFTQRSLYTQQVFTQQIFYTQQAFTEKSFYREKLSCTNHNRNCSSKTGWISMPQRNKDDFAALFKRILNIIFIKGKLLAAKLRKLLTNHCLSLGAPTPIYSNTIYEIQLQHSCSHYNAFWSITWLTRISPAWQQSRSHSNAIRNQSFKKRIELRTQEQPLVAEQRGGTNSRQKRPQPQRPHGCNHFTRKNARFPAPASSPKQSAWNIHAAITLRFAASRG